MLIVNFALQIQIQAQVLRSWRIYLAFMEKYFLRIMWNLDF
jgi:hypothetical protein